MKEEAPSVKDKIKKLVGKKDQKPTPSDCWQPYTDFLNSLHSHFYIKDDKKMEYTIMSIKLSFATLLEEDKTEYHKITVSTKTYLDNKMMEVSIFRGLTIDCINTKSFIDNLAKDEEKEN